MSAIQGWSGKLKLKRGTEPAPITLRVEDQNLSLNCIQAGINYFWSGDQVTLSSPNGIPTEPNQDGVNMFFGNMFTTASNRDHITSETDSFFEDDDSVPFFFENVTVTSGNYFIHRDVTNRISFYHTRAAALNGRQEDRVPLQNLDWGTAVMSYVPLDLEILGQLVGWELQFDATSVDTTSVGELYGENVCANVKGGGRLDCLIERVYTEEQKLDPAFLLQLLLLLKNRGNNAYAQFWIIEDRDASPECGKLLLPGDLYYEAEILITTNTVNVQATSLVGLTAQFVTTGPFELKVGVRE